MQRDVVDQKIVESMQQLWAQVLKVRAYASPYLDFQTLLLPEEYQSIFSEKHRGMLPRISEDEHNKQFAIILSLEYERIRPFVGESLWRSFFIYRAFWGRQVFKVREGLKRGHLFPWDCNLDGKPNDSFLKVLEEQLSVDAVKSVRDTKPFSNPHMVSNLLEQQLLTEINDWVFDRTRKKLTDSIIPAVYAINGDFHVAGDFVGRDKLADS